MTSAAKAVTFAEQRAFAAKVAKEKAAIERAIEQNTEEQQEQQQPRRRVRQRRTTRDGQDIFAVTFFDGDKPQRTDWLAEDARKNAEFGVVHPAKGSLGHRLRQLKGKGLSKSRSEPCLSTKKRERKEEDSTNPNPFRAVFPLPAKGIDMRKETARDQADLFDPRPETVTLSATEKHEMRTWGVDVDAVTWPNGTKQPPWIKAVGNTTNKWANKELGIRAAREEQEFVEKLQASPCRDKQRHIVHPATGSPPSASSPLSFSPSTKTAPLPPWVKELPPVRDGRRQFASGEIISSLDQHTYPEGGVAEAKRARRREKEAFLNTVFVANDHGAAGHLAAPGKNAPHAAAGTTGTFKKRPPQAHRVCKEPGAKIDSAGGRAVRRERSGPAWPYGPLKMAVPTPGTRTSGRRRSGDSGRGGSSTGEVKCSAADGGAAVASPPGAAVYDAARPVLLKADAGVVVVPRTDAADAGPEAADAGNSSPADETGGAAAAGERDTEHPGEEVAGERSSGGCAGKESHHHTDGRQQLQPEEEPRQQGKESGPAVTDQERVPRAATPSPVVTSSVTVLDMGVVRPLE